MYKYIICFCLFFSIFISCDNPPEDAAEVTEAHEVKKPDEDKVLEITTYLIQPSGSELSWIGSKPAGKHYGSLGIEEGLIYAIGDSIAGGKILINMDDIEVSDLKSDEDTHMKLVEHLKSPDFFDVENYPVSVFEITKVLPFKASENEDSSKRIESQKLMNDEQIIPTHTISGNLTMKAKTLGISFPAQITINANEISGKAIFTIDRTEWGISYRKEADFINKVQDKLIYDDVVLKLDLQANPENENL